MHKLFAGIILFLAMNCVSAAEETAPKLTLACLVSGNTSDADTALDNEEITLRIDGEKNTISTSGLIIGQFGIESVSESAISFSSDAPDNSSPHGIAGTLDRYSGTVSLNDTDMGHGLKMRLSGTCEIAERKF